MTQNDRSSKALASQRPVEAMVPARVPARPARQDHNHPIAIETFDREHMGIAAKE